MADTPLTEEGLKRLLGNSGSNSASSNTGFGAEASKLLGGMGDGIGKFLGYIKDAGKKFDDSIDIWRKAGQSGATFGNDVIGMSVAAAGARMNLKELESIVSQNSSSFTGLGGSVSKGAQEFANLSKKMFEASDATDALRQMGYTNRELNDVLVTQIGFAKSSMRTDAASQEQSIRASTELATEMDQMAKLTGKSREAQLEEMKKNQADMALEAKFRLIGIQQGADAEKKAREGFAIQYNEAKLRGEEQILKETFATGTIMSKDAAMQYAAGGKAAAATMEQGIALGKGNIEAAKAANERAMVEAEKNQKDVSRLTAATWGAAGGDFTKAVQKNMGSMDSYHHALEKVTQETGLTGDAARKEALRRIAEEQKETGGATSAAIKFEARLRDAESALYTGLVDPINKRVKPALDNIANSLGGQVNVTKGGKTEKQAVSKYLEDKTRKGVEEGMDLAAGKGTKKSVNQVAADKEKVEHIGGGEIGSKVVDVAGLGAKTAGFAAGGAVELGAKAANWSTNTISGLFDAKPGKVELTNSDAVGKHIVDNLPKKAEGGVVDNPMIAIVGEAGKEAIVNQRQAAEAFKNIAGSAVSSFTKMMPQMPSIGATPGGFNLAGAPAKLTEAMTGQSTGMEKTAKDLSESISKVLPVKEVASAAEQMKSKLTTAQQEFVNQYGKLSDENKKMEIDVAASKMKEHSETIGMIQDRIDEARASLTDKKLSADQKKVIDAAIKEDEGKKKYFQDQYASSRQHFENMSNLGALTAIQEKELAEERANIAVQSAATQTEAEKKKANAVTVADIKPAEKSAEVPGKVIEAASPTKPAIKPIDGKLVLDKTGRPSIQRVQEEAKQIPASQKEADEIKRKEAEKKDADKKAAEKKDADAKSKPATSTPADKDKATLSDVVKQLNQLNTQMSQFISQSENLGKKQIKASMAGAGVVR